MIIFSEHLPDQNESLILRTLYKIDGITLLNFSGMRSDIPNIFELTPPGNLQSLYGYSDDVQLDEQTRDNLYCRYITENNVSFIGLMRIITTLYEYNNTAIWLLITHSDYRDDYANCFAKLLVTRYGILCNEVGCLEDMDSLKQAEFSLYGLANYQLDRERYLAISGMAEGAVSDGLS